MAKRKPPSETSWLSFVRVGTILTGLTVIIYAGQYIIGRDSLNQARVQSNSSVASTGIAAEQLEIARSALQSGTIQIIFPTLKPPSYAGTARVIVSNQGVQPIYVVSVNTIQGIWTGGRIDLRDFPSDTREMAKTESLSAPFTLHQNGKREFWHTDGATADDPSDRKVERQYMINGARDFIFSRLIYRDALGKTHVTFVCDINSDKEGDVCIAPQDT